MTCSTAQLDEVLALVDSGSAQQIVRADNIRASLNLAACNLQIRIFSKNGFFGYHSFVLG